MLFAMIHNGLRTRQAFLCDARLHPDFRCDAAVEEFIIASLREDLSHDLPIWPRRHRARDSRTPVALDVQQRLPELAEANHHGIRAGYPFVANGGAVGRNAFGLQAGSHPTL